MMTGEEFENHWRFLAQAVDTLLNLKPGEYPPISYEQTYSAVYKCVCHGFAEVLYARLLEEMERQLRLFSDRLQSVPDDQLVEAFNSAWLYFSGGLTGIVPIFNYLARFYVEAKLNLNLRSELTKVFDKTVLQSVIDRLFKQLRFAQNSAFAVQPATMESVVHAMYKLRPNTVKELPDLYRRFIPELIQHVRVDELPDLQEEARRMMTEARNAFSHRIVNEEMAAAGTLQCHPSVASGYLPYNESVDAVMDFHMDEDSASEPCDPATSVARRLKRPRSHVDSGDEGSEDINDSLQVDPEEPSPSPRSLERYRQLGAHGGSSGQRLRKHFHGDSGNE